LLSLSGTTESEITYFMKEPPAKAIVEQKKRPTTAPNNNLRNGRVVPRVNLYDSF
jgi:hypothetical protein